MNTRDLWEDIEDGADELGLSGGEADGIWSVNFNSHTEFLIVDPEMLPSLTVYYQVDEDSEPFEKELEYHDIVQFLFVGFLSFIETDFIHGYFPRPEDDDHPFFVELERACHQYLDACKLRAALYLRQLHWQVNPERNEIILAHPHRDDYDDVYGTGLRYDESVIYRVKVEGMKDASSANDAVIEDAHVEHILGKCALFYEHMIDWEEAACEPVQRLQDYLLSDRGRRTLEDLVLPAKVQPIEFVACQKGLFLSDAETAELVGVTVDTLNAWHAGKEIIPFAAMEKLGIIKEYIHNMAKQFESLVEESLDFDYKTNFQVVLVGYDNYEDLVAYQPTYAKTLPYLNLHRALLWEIKRLLSEGYQQYVVRIVSFDKDSFQQWLANNDECDKPRIFPWDDARTKWAYDQVVRSDLID